MYTCSSILFRCAIVGSLGPTEDVKVNRTGQSLNQFALSLLIYESMINQWGTVQLNSKRYMNVDTVRGHTLQLLNQSAPADLSIDDSPIRGSLCDIRDHMSPTCKVASEEGLRRLVQVYNRTSHTDRNTVQMGNGWGARYLLDQKPNEPCVFFSYGISRDWTFDSQLAMDWNCEGLLFDPTTNHPPVMQPGNLKFTRKGAPILGKNSFEVISPVKLRKELKYERVHVLKMDCEGCEYALIKDMAQEDPNFFDRIEQFSVEIHLSRKWIRSNEHMNNLGLLYHVLFSAGFELIHKDITHCAPKDEATGCPDVLKSMGYPCHAHCHNYLFARPNVRHGSGSYDSSDILTRMKLDRHEEPSTRSLTGMRSP